MMPRWFKPSYGTALNLSDLIPLEDEIPHEFHRVDNRWHAVAATWFHHGHEALDGELVAHPGVNAYRAHCHIAHLLTRTELSQEHKLAGTAFLMSLWFSRFQPAVGVQA